MHTYAWQTQEPAHIYIHIPYCLKKCPYCDFVSYCMSEAAVDTADYVEVLVEEIRQLLAHDSDQEIKTIYFGGGTPSALPASDLLRILGEIRRRRALAETCEITLEMNPGTRDFARLPELRAGGFNRLSIGLQTSSDERLKRIGRIHTREDYLLTLAKARGAGFTNISTDLMSALPYETLEDVKEDVDFLLGLDLPHISTYSLIIEEDTPFGRLYQEGVWPLPDEETERAMYHLIRDLLAQAGYLPYEISNSAKEGYFSQHNLAYWLGESYYGFGAGASSYVSGQRRTNPASLEDYASQVRRGAVAPVEEVITPEEAEKEFYIFRLRIAEGFSESEFEERFGKKIPAEVKAVLASHVASGLLANENDRWFYTRKGLDFADQVARDLLSFGLV